jgi:hypothetical protein
MASPNAVLYGTLVSGCEVEIMNLPQQRSLISLTALRVNVSPLTDHL